MNYKRLALQVLNSLLNLAGLELIRMDKKYQNYINIRKTLSNAKAAGMSVGDYIDFTFNVPGATQLTVDKMIELGVFCNKINTVCEIGPGSGRYLEKTIDYCHPQRYEIYETAKAWRKWLGSRYPVIAYDADGATLSYTRSHSMDLVQAHKVFPGLKVFEIINYCFEMMRVCAPEGFIVFDLLTEECIKFELLPAWLEENASWPCAIIPSSVVENLFIKRGAELIGRFTIPMKPGVTEYFVFKNHLLRLAN